MDITEAIKEKFWARVNKKDPNECWEWEASLSRKGYGQFRLKFKTYRAHRISWMIHFGDIPPEALILHKCDNRKCVNPNHLYPGTHMDNRRDAITRNRLPISNFYAGEAWLMKRLWNSGKFSWAKIGRMFECSRYTVGNICTGKVKNFREIDKSLPTLKHLISQLRSS